MRSEREHVCSVVCAKVCLQFDTEQQERSVSDGENDADAGWHSNRTSTTTPNTIDFRVTCASAIDRLDSGRRMYDSAFKGRNAEKLVAAFSEKIQLHVARTDENIVAMIDSPLKDQSMANATSWNRANCTSGRECVH